MKMSLSASWLKKPVVIALIALICGAPVFAMGITNIAQVPATITLSPDSGYGHTIVEVSGSDFTKSESVVVDFAGVRVLSMKTDSYGSFMGNFIVPTDQDGVYTVSAVDGKGRKAPAPFKVITNPMLDEVKREVKNIEGKLDQLLKPPLPPLTFEVKIGALLDFTGDLADYGDASEAAINLAVGEVNELLGEAGAPWTLKVLFKDTQTMPDIALEKLKELYEKEGIKFIVGPLSSGEVRNIKDYADANKILVVSHASTAPDLAIPDDYIFRFCPQDKSGQGPAIARLMYEEGISTVVAVYRNDTWGTGLVDATEARFIELTGGGFAEKMSYDPVAPDFQTLAENLANEVVDHGADGVLYIGFEEAVDFFKEAKGYPILWDVKWYGSEGTLIETLLDPAVADFCAATGFINTMFGPTKSDKYWKVHDKLVDVLEREPDPYAYVAYDIVWAYAYSFLTVDKYDSEAVRTVLQSLRSFSFFGASGLIVLDENGDRTVGDYDLWAIVEVEAGKYEWKLLGTYIHATDSITWFILYGEVKIGALLPLTGELATYGENEKVAIELAVEEVNAFLKETGAPWTLKVLFEDTGCDPATALNKLKSLAAMGIKFIVGPLSSGEVKNIKDYADANKILVVSHGSTAVWPELLEDDFIFRFYAQDAVQGRAIAKLMWKEEVSTVVAVYNMDWGTGLVDATEKRFKELTGNYFAEKIPYDPEVADFPTSLAENLASAVEKHGANGVLYIGGEEAVDFFTEAKIHDILRTVKWYGSEGTCKYGTLLDPAVADFCATTPTPRFINPIFSPTKSDKYWEVHDEVWAVYEREADPYAYVAYDIVWALTHSLLTVNMPDSVAVKAVLPEVTESLFGASGLIVLDENGDRASGDYDLWIIAEVDTTGVYEWKLVGTWFYDTDSITWL